MAAIATDETNPKVIEMQDMTSFKWVMLNVLGHDFMHDFLLNTARTKKGSVEVGNKKVSIIKKVNKTCRAISKYLKSPGFRASLTDTKGGGFFDNPVENKELVDIDYKEMIETTDGPQQSNYSSYEKELNHMLCMLKELEGDVSQSKEGCGFDVDFMGDEGEKEPVTRDQLTEYVHTYFQNLYDTETDDQGKIIGYNPKIIKILAEGMVSGVLSPIIKKVLEIGSTHQSLNKDLETYIRQELDNSLFNIESLETEDPSEADEEASTTSAASAAEKSSEEPLHSDVIGEKFSGNTDELYGRALDEIEISFGRIFGMEMFAEDRIDRTFRLRGQDILPFDAIEANPNVLFSQKDNNGPSEDTSISEIEDTITNGLYNDKVFFDLTKKLIIKNFVDAYSSRVGYRKGMFSIFKRNEYTDEFIFDMEPIYKTIDDLTKTLNNKFNIDMQSADESGESFHDYDIFSKSKNPVDEFLNILIENNILLENTPGSNDQETLKILFHRAIMVVHPDKNQGDDKMLELAKVVISQYKRLNKTFVHTGGFIQKGGALDDDKLFAVMNTILNKAIIENSLVLMDCVSGDKSFGYFPDVRSGGLPQGRYDIRLHKGLRPNFKNIFSGEILQSFLQDDNFSVKTGGTVSDIMWNVMIEPGNLAETLEVRKILAKRILLNTQILILYQRCIPSGISTNSLFEGLLLKMDNKKRKTNDLKKRGYLTMTLNGPEQNLPEFPQQFGFNSLDHAVNNVYIRRKRYFGMLFDNTNPDVLPDWFKRSNTEDDMLQNAFNIVLVKLLPEFIFELGKQPDILSDEDETNHKADIPEAGVHGENAYVINNAVPLIYPQLKKASQDRFGFLNLNGLEARKSQFCPVTSIADSQPLCSIKTKTSLKETVPRALNYSMEMGLEAPITAGTYSYYINMQKKEPDSDNYLFYISGVLTGPDFLIHIGDERETLDLKLGPLSAVNTFYKILQNISLISKESVLSHRKRKFEPRVILRQFFESNCEILMKAGVIKSIGDYGQEFTALSKYGATTKTIYNSNNTMNDGKLKTIPYNDNGNALRFMVANDRPSAYRGIFISLFANQETINTRSVLGYYRERRQQGLPSKNTLVMGMNVLNNSGGINSDPNGGDRAVTFTDDASRIVDESRSRGRLKNVLRIRRSARQEGGKPSSKTITMFFRRYPEFKVWSKQRGIVIQPTNFRKRARQFSDDFNKGDIDVRRRINFEGNLAWVMRGGKKKRKRKTRKHKKRKRKTKKRKRKSYRKNKKSNKHKKKKNKKSKKRNKKR